MAQTFTKDWAAVDTRKYASGGYVSDGLSDSVPAMINGQIPAALSEGEFVVPADVVSGIGNGSTSAGAKRLLEMIENVRKARTGKEAAPPKIRVER
ncbi:MAG: hypothetical protein E6Q97_25725 [Desulfurellales bacterium]|nr:MAG: hypothetical protein E6Q97_25725 [Desulfurellales bacterium]